MVEIVNLTMAEALAVLAGDRALLRRRQLEARLDREFSGVSTAELKRRWDALTQDDAAFYDDCDDLHAELNRRGEGRYCAV